MVQPLDYWRYSGNPFSEHFVYAVQRPRVMNVMKDSGGQLQRFLKGIHKWTRSSRSDVGGTWHLHSPESISDKRWSCWRSAQFLIGWSQLRVCLYLPYICVTIVNMLSPSHSLSSCICVLLCVGLVAEMGCKFSCLFNDYV